MAGQAQVNKNAPAGDLGAMTRRKLDGDNVWVWVTTIDGTVVQIVLRGAMLRTIASRATTNKSGRAQQGGMTATDES